MDNNKNRRLLIAVGSVLLFVIVVLVWYFFYTKPIVAPSMGGTNNPLPTRTLPSRFQFLTTWGESGASSSTTEVTPGKPLPLIKVWDKPSSGQTFITTTILKEESATTTVGTTTTLIKRTVRATSTSLLFVDRVTGYVYAYPFETGKVYQVSNSIIPGVYDAYFFDNGKRVIMRYVDQEKNTVVGLIATVPTVSTEGNPLPLENIKYLTSKVTSLAINTQKNEVSYVVTTEGGSAVYTVSGTKEPSLVSSSPFREWSLSYGGNQLYVTTKPSAYIEGTTFSLPYFQAEVSDKTGLVSNPGPSGSILNSMWGRGGLVTFFSNNGSTKLSEATTIASKCAWGSGIFIVCAVPRELPRAVEGLPDDWFQGRTSFSDDLFILDTVSGDPYSLYTFSEKEGVFDITNISLSGDNAFLSFNKKQDASLWLLNTTLLEGD